MKIVRNLSVYLHHSMFWYWIKILARVLLWIIAIYCSAKFIDNYVFRYLRPGTPMATMERNLRRHYQLSREHLPPVLREKVVELTSDDETRAFLTRCQTFESQFFTFLGNSIVYTYLRPFVTLTNLHAFLNRGSMFVLSKAHLTTLLKSPTRSNGDVSLSNSIVDLGAGDGKVSAKLAEWAKVSSRSEIKVTEVSKSMKYRLKERGFTVVDAERWTSYKPFTLVTMLNLLDRCEKPLNMIRSAHEALSACENKSVPRLLIASVFPFRQSIEWRSSRKADEFIRINGTWSIEEQAGFFIQKIVEPQGFELESLSRVPYICEGDVKAPYYVLNNVIMVFKLKDSSEPN